MFVWLFLLVLELSEKLWQGNPECSTCAGLELVDHNPAPAGEEAPCCLHQHAAGAADQDLQSC